MGNSGFKKYRTEVLKIPLFCLFPDRLEIERPYLFPFFAAVSKSESLTKHFAFVVIYEMDEEQKCRITL